MRRAQALTRLLAISVILALPLVAAAADTWSTPFPGVKRLHRKTSNQNINALVIDLCSPGISLRATASSERKRTTSSFGKLVGGQAAINGDFFSYSTYGTSGLAMSGGAVWAGTGDGASWAPVAIGPGKIEIPHHSNITAVQPWMKEVVSGQPTLLDDGVVVGKPGDFCTARHPRTIVGISKDQRKLILAVVDGRASTRIGMTCSELATLLKELGAWDGVNLDGGGSSTIWLSSAGVVNYPSDGSERVVGNHLALHAKGSGAAPHCPGPPPHPEIGIKLALATDGQTSDLCTAGSSKGVLDWWAGQESAATVDLKNVGAAVAKNVEVSLWAEEPYLKIRSWQILSDWQAAGVFKVNDTDALQKIPRNDPGQTFKLWLSSISPGETKRVKLLVRADRGSLAGPVDHPDLRAWVAHIDGYYDKTDFAAAPKNTDGLQKQNGGDLRAHVQTDVLEKERCDGKDNDCNGQVDEDCSPNPPLCEAGAGPEPSADGGPPLPQNDGSLEPQPQPLPSEGEGGCAVLPPAPAVPLWPVVVLLLGLFAVRRRRG